MLIDSHAHLDDPQFAPDRDAVLSRAAAAGVEAVISIGTDVASSATVITLAQRAGPVRVYGAVGVHPHAAAAFDDEAARALRALAAEPGVVAIGEIGLDYYRDRAPRPAQRLAFEAQLELAVAMERPVVIHNRDAHDDVLAVLGDWAPRLSQPAGVMHCFSGDQRFASRCLDLGFFISFAGPLTYKEAGPLREVAAALPLGALLVETDAPYLSPAPYRGRRNEPANVRVVAEALAAARGQSLAAVAAATAQNTARLFRLPVGARAQEAGR